MDRFSIPSSLISAKLSQNVAELRSRITDVSTEAVTGQRADLTKHLSGRIGDAMLSQKALQDIQTDRGTLNLRASRLDVVQKSLASIQTSTDGLPARLHAAVGAESQLEVAGVARDAANAIDTLMSSMNVRLGDRYLFSGDATSTQPFTNKDALLADIRLMAETAADAADFEAQLDTYFNSPDGGWQQSIYQGAATASDPDAVTPIDPAITKLMSGLAVLALAGENDSPALLRTSGTSIEAAADKVAEGQVALTNLRANVGVIENRIEQGKAALDAEEMILTQVFSDIASRDQYEAAAELRELESNLEASYLLTARLSNLSLLNFLR